MPLGRSRLVVRLKVLLKRRGAMKTASRWLLETARLGFMRLCRVFCGIDKNKIVFSCFNARTYGDNLKPISELLHEMHPQSKIVWVFRDPKSKAGVTPDYVVRRDPISLKGLFEYATARVWVDNFTMSRFMVRRRGSQFYMNTWHGDRAFKKIAYDMFPERRLRIEETCDVMLAGSEFGKKLMRSAFRFEGELLTEGCPRNDILVNGDKNLVKSVRAKLGVPDNAKLLLYAPTFRDADRLNKLHCGIDLESVLNVLNEATGDNWVCLYRAHHLSRGGLDLTSGGRLFDMTKYEDMADLLLVSDALITDYSSSAMDFALTGRRVFLYQDDIDLYTSRDRELYYKMEDTPFLVASDQAGLEKIIRETTDDIAKKNCEDIKKFFGFIETGHASRSACEKIIYWMDIKGIR